MSEEVEDFLVHYGIAGMKWGKRKAKSDSDTDKKPRAKMSREKKIAIAVGVGATLAIGAAITVSILNNKKTMNTPITSMVKQPSTSKGKEAVKASDTYLLDSYRNDMVERAKKAQPLPDKAALDAYRKSELTKAKSSNTDGHTILGNRLQRAGLSPSDLNRNSTPRPTSPDLNTLSSLINGGPQVSFNPKTGRYETR